MLSLKPGRSQPDDYVQEVNIGSDDGGYIPIPNVGDSVILKLEGDSNKAYKVLTRNFTYMADWCAVKIVVTDISRDEMAARLKE